MSAGKGMSWRGGTGSGSGEGESLTVRISGLVGRVHLVDALVSWLGNLAGKVLYGFTNRSVEDGGCLGNHGSVDGALSALFISSSLGKGSGHKDRSRGSGWIV